MILRIKVSKANQNYGLKLIMKDVYLILKNSIEASSICQGLFMFSSPLPSKAEDDMY